MMINRLLHIVILPPIAAVAIAVVSTSVATAQPSDWGCDYGFRPGNAWFYRSAMFNGQVYCQSVQRDSLGADGAYWTFIKNFTLGYWYRIDSACTFDMFFDPSSTQFKQWFVEQADSGDMWAVGAAGGYSSVHARIDTIRRRSIFGRDAITKNVVYSHSDYGGQTWYRSEEWAEGLGVVESWEMTQGHDELIGAIIDGVHYGNTSGVDEGVVEGADHIIVYPSPASHAATIVIPAGSERGATIAVHDLLGRLVQREQIAIARDGMTAIPLDVSGFAPGAYIIAVDLDGVRYTTPLVVAR